MGDGWTVLHLMLCALDLDVDSITSDVGVPMAGRNDMSAAEHPDPNQIKK